MLGRLIGNLPDWAQKKHPHMRYLISGEQKSTRIGRIIALLSLLTILGVFGIIGYINASNFFDDNLFDLPFSMFLFEFLFWGMLILQVGVAISALLPPIGFIASEKAKQTWDGIRTTHQGIGLLMRARWSVVVFHRLRQVMILLWVARLVLIGGLLYDLTGFGGEYLRSLSANITPKLDQVVVIVLVVMGITASLLMPLTAIGFNSALGLWLSTWVKKRVYIALLQTMLVMFQAIMAGGFAFLFLSIRDEQIASQLLSSTSQYIPTVLLWFLLLGFAVFADWGITFLYLGLYAGTIWAKIPYGIFLGAGALMMVFIQAFLTDRLIGWTIRRAERSE